jgi:hypothetical protein
VQAQDLVRVCARAERESQDRQNKFSHIWEYDPERFLMRLSGLNHVNRKVFTTVNLLAQGCFLPNHLDRILVFADPEKDGLPESIIACPFRESDLIGSTQRHRFISTALNPIPGPLPGFDCKSHARRR